MKRSYRTGIVLLYLALKMAIYGLYDENHIGYFMITSLIAGGIGMFILLRDENE